jgi:hypothetical protein
MIQEEIKKFVTENPRLVTMRESASHPGLFVLKYTKRVFYDSLWNNFLEQCRGTIVDANFNVVARPFTKIYNYGVEKQAPVLALDTPLSVYRKVNGFMVAVTTYQGKMLVSTAGSTDNDYTRMAREMMATHNPLTQWQDATEFHSSYTFMFECVHPNDPHIVTETPGMYFLGCRENSWDSVVLGSSFFMWDQFARDVLGCHVAEHQQLTLAQLIQLSREAQHEGFVAYTMDHQAFKIKTPYYLTSKWVARNPRTDKLMTKEFRQQIDEEYYDLLDHLRANITHYTTLSEQERLCYVRKFLHLENPVPVCALM